MLWTIFVVLMVVWIVGMISAYTLGGALHVLLAFAVVVLLVQLTQGRSIT